MITNTDQYKNNGDPFSQGTPTSGDNGENDYQYNPAGGAYEPGSSQNPGSTGPGSDPYSGEGFMTADQAGRQNFANTGYIDWDAGMSFLEGQHGGYTYELKETPWGAKHRYNFDDGYMYSPGNDTRDQYMNPYEMVNDANTGSYADSWAAFSSLGLDRYLKGDAMVAGDAWPDYSGGMTGKDPYVPDNGGGGGGTIPGVTPGTTPGVTPGVTPPIDPVTGGIAKSGITPWNGLVRAPGQGGDWPNDYWTTDQFELTDANKDYLWGGLEGLWNESLTDQWQTFGGVNNAMRKIGDNIMIQTPDGDRSWTYNTNVPGFAPGTEGADRWNANDFFNQNKDIFGGYWNTAPGWDYSLTDEPDVPGIDPLDPTNPTDPYVPPFPIVPMNAEEASEYGIGAMKQLLDQAMQNETTMPDFWGNGYEYLDAQQYQDWFPDFINPQSLDRIDFSDYGGYEQEDYNTEKYRGLSDGDYDLLEKNLRTPGETAAGNAYQEGYQKLNSYMGNSGMYGSSVMAQQANQGLDRTFQDTLSTNAANAVAERYGLQQNDLQFGAELWQNDRQFLAEYQDQGNQFSANYGLDIADLEYQQNKDWTAQENANINAMRDYNNRQFLFGVQNTEAGRAEHNQLIKDKYGYETLQANWQNMMNEQLMNKASALTGQTAGLSQAAQNYRMQQERMDASDSNAQWNMYMQGLGGIFGMGSEGGYDDSIGAGVIDWLSGL